MTIRNWSRVVKDELGHDFVVSGESMNSGNSPYSIVSGKRKLRLTPQRMDYVKSTAIVHRRTPTGPSNDLRAWSPPPGGAVIYPPPGGYDFSKLDNQAWARFQGKLRKGSASLGVTMASWKQSRDMIVDRSNYVRRTLDSSIAALGRNPGGLRRLKKERQPLANQVLETEFGWRPLFSDIHAALFTACKGGIPPEWVTSRAKSPMQQSWVDGSNPIQRHSLDGMMWTTYNAKVAISNPNLWLLNRLGLVNPATVVWDLIPWSFVFGMFVNVNQMIQALTSEVGLSISDQSVTRSVRFGYERLQYSAPTTQYPLGYPGPSFGRVSGVWKRRGLYTSLQPTWQVKVPDFSWELALIATSLVVQRFEKINRMIRLV